MHPLFTEGTRPYTAQFHHVCTGTQCESHVMAERTNVCSGIAFDAEQDKAPFIIENLQFVNSADPKYAFHRTFPRGALIESSCELSSNLFDSVFVHIPVQSHQADIFLIVLEEKWGKTDRVTEHDKKHS
jgi:hypothetical protein